LRISGVRAVAKFVVTLLSIAVMGKMRKYLNNGKERRFA